MLLKANPEAAKCEHYNLVHKICECTKGNLFKSVISLFLATDKDALKIATNNGILPAHDAALLNTAATIDCLLKICPESAPMVGPEGSKFTSSQYARLYQ